MDTDEPEKLKPEDFDDVITGRGFTIARKGRFIYMNTDRSEEEHRAILQDLVNQKDNLLQSIKQRVQELEDILQQYNPLDIIANISLANSILDADSFKEYTHPGNPAFTEYLATLCITRPLDAYRTTDLGPVSGEVLEDIQERIKALFTNQVFYLATKDIDVNNMNPPDVLSELRFETLLHSIWVRYSAYQHHLVDMLRGLFTPLQADLERTFGFSIDDALGIAESIERIVMDRLTERRKEAREFEEQLRGAVKKFRQKGKVVGDFSKELLERLVVARPSESAKQIQSIVIAWVFFALGDTFSVTAAELAEKSGIVIERVAGFLEYFSLEFGQIEARYRFPSPTHPMMQKPMIRHEDQFFCPVFQNLDWSLRLGIEEAWNPDSSTALVQDKDLWERYNRTRARYLEQKALDYLGGALKHATVYRNLKYRVVEDREEKGSELDGMIIVDSALFLLEAKSGTISPSARRGSKDSIVEDLEKLVKNASTQASRAKRYIQQTDQPQFLLGDGTVIEIPKQRIDHIFLIAVTLDNLDVFVTNLYQLRELGLFQDDELPWIVCLTDLRVICEMVEFSSQIVNYLERRQRINEQKFAKANDELEWFGHYLMEGLYFENIKQQQERQEVLELLPPYTTPFDDYYLYLTDQRTTPAERPIQPMPAVMHQMLTELENRHPDGYLDACCALLDMNGETREDFVEKATLQRRRTLQDREFHDFTLLRFKDLGITFIFTPIERLSDMASRIKTYSMLKKYQTKFSTWIAFGCVVDSREWVSHLYVDVGPWIYDEEKERLVKERLLPLKSDLVDSNPSVE